MISGRSIGAHSAVPWNRTLSTISQLWLAEQKPVFIGNRTEE